MLRMKTSLAAVAAVAMGMTAATMMLTQPADAAMKRKHYRVAKKYRGAMMKPGYVGAPGYAGGPAPYNSPPNAANPGLLGGGGFLGTGTIPQTQIFYGVPVLGQFGF